MILFRRQSVKMKILCLFFFLPLAFGRNQSNVKYVGLRQLGKYSGVNDEGVAYEKTYYISNYLKLTPPSARSFCKSYGVNVDLASFELRDEFIAVRSKLEPEVRDKGIFVIVGGFSQTINGKNYYHWISSGKIKLN